MAIDEAARLWMKRVSAVQGTYAQVSDGCDLVEAHLSSCFSRDAPDLLAILGDTPEERKEWLKSMFDIMVASMAHLTAVLPTMRVVAVRYADQGIQPSHYETLQRAVTEALALVIGESRFSPFLRESWDIAFSIFRRAMVHIGFTVSKQLAKELVEHDPAGLAPARASSY